MDSPQSPPESPSPSPKPTPSSSGVDNLQISDLPPEVRQKIYAPFLPQKRVVQVDTSAHLCEDDSAETRPLGKMNPDLLVLCKTVMADCLEMLYGNNIFEVWLHENGETTLEASFSAANRRRIRHLVLVARSGGVSSIWSEPRIPLWSSLLPRLKVLQLSISSFVYDTDRAKYCPPAEARAWRLWIEPYLALCSEYLVPGTEVYVRDMRGEDVLMIFSKYIPPALRIRSDFSPRAGSWWTFTTQSLEWRVLKGV